LHHDRDRNGMSTSVLGVSKNKRIVKGSVLECDNDLAAMPYYLLPSWIFSAAFAIGMDSKSEATEDIGK
jgi:hypothetical protein